MLVKSREKSRLELVLSAETEESVRVIPPRTAPHRVRIGGLTGGDQAPQRAGALSSDATDCPLVAR
jgi:hypothetical protein